jgi:hypothetical protein
MECREGLLFNNGISLGLKRNMEMHVTVPAVINPHILKLAFIMELGM